MQALQIEVPTPSEGFTPSQRTMFENWFNLEWWDKTAEQRKSGEINKEQFCKDFHAVSRYMYAPSAIHDLQRTFDKCTNAILTVQDEHNSDIKELKEQHKTLLFNDRRHDSRLEKLEHQAVNMAIKLDHVETYAKQIPALADSINRLHDTVNIALQQSTTQPKPAASPQAKPKLSTVLSSIPTAGYIVGGVVSIALISAATGHLGEFFAWLGSAKILGGVK